MLMQQRIKKFISRRKAAVIALGLAMVLGSLAVGAFGPSALQQPVRKPLIMASTDGNSIAGPVADFVELLVVYSDGFVFLHTAQGTRAQFADEVTLAELAGRLALLGVMTLDDFVRVDGGACSADAPFVTVTAFDVDRPFDPQSQTNSFTYDAYCLGPQMPPSSLGPQFEVAEQLCVFVGRVFGAETRCPFFSAE